MLPPTVQDDNRQDHRPKALLIEEFPNTFSRTSNALLSFRSILEQYVSTTVSGASLPTPMIMVISETLLSTNTAAADTNHYRHGPGLVYACEAITSFRSPNSPSRSKANAAQSGSASSSVSVSPTQITDPNKVTTVLNLASIPAFPDTAGGDLSTFAVGWLLP